MILRCLLLYICALPAVCNAQHWRIEGSAGVAVPHLMNVRSKLLPRSLYNAMTLPDIYIERSLIRPIAGLRLMRRDSAYEYGVGVQSMVIKYSGYRWVDTGNGNNGKSLAVNQFVYLARPALPVTAFFNYTHQRRSSHAFIGLNAGIILAQGRQMKDFNELKTYENFEIYFQNGLGYTLGGQIGFRRVFGAVDVGLELSANYVHLPLRQGSSNRSFDYNLLYFPVKGFIGYSF